MQVRYSSTSDTLRGWWIRICGCVCFPKKFILTRNSFFRKLGCRGEPKQLLKKWWVEMSFRSTIHKNGRGFDFCLKKLYGYGISMRNEILFDLKTKLQYVVFVSQKMLLIAMLGYSCNHYSQMAPIQPDSVPCALLL